MKRYLSHSTEETEQIAAEFASTLKSGDVIAYKGPMGAGKTAFTRGLCKGLGLSDHVSSPTFALVHQYGNGSRALYHFGGILAIEWSENIEAVLPENTITVEIRKVDGDPEQREILISQ